MKMFFFILFLFSDLAMAIDGGRKVSPGDYPSVIKITNWISGRNTHCTGTLLSPKIVLTAAHCVEKNYFNEQMISRPGDPRGEFAVFGKKKYKIKNVYYNDEFKSINSEIELLKEWMQTNIYQERSQEFHLQTLQRLQKLESRKINLDLAFIELRVALEIDSEIYSSISCDSLPEMVEVNLVGYGQNILTIGEKNQNPNFFLLEGHNWYTFDRDYTLYPQTGNLFNLGDSGGPLFKKENQKDVFGVASFKVIDDRTFESKRCSYASTSSKEAKELYLEILRDPHSPKELKQIVSKCSEKIKTP